MYHGHQSRDFYGSKHGVQNGGKGRRKVVNLDKSSLFLVNLKKGLGTTTSDKGGKDLPLDFS